MSIYVKTQRGATPLQTPQLRRMEVGTGWDTLERADKVSTIIRSLTMVLNDIPTGLSFHPTGLPDSIQQLHDFWIDLANSFIRRHSGSITYPITFVNPKLWEDSISCSLENGGKTLKVFTGTSSWSDYELVVTIKYTDAPIFR